MTRFASFINGIDYRLTNNLNEVMGGDGAIMKSELEKLRQETVENAERIYGEMATANTVASERA